MRLRLQLAHRFFQLPMADRLLLLRAALLLALVRVALWLLPLRMLRRLLMRVAPAPVPAAPVDAATVERLAWAVSVAGDLVPDATCLPQALVMQMLLHRRGYPAQLRAGLTRSDAGRIEGHAWVECGGRVVLGDSGLECFTPIEAFERRSA